MIVNQAALVGIKTSFNTLFNKAFTESKPLWDKVAMKVTSTTSEESYKWLGSFPKMREWIGDRQIQNLIAADYTIKNEDFELTIAVDRNDINDDKLGVYGPMIEMIGQEAAMLPDDLVFGLLKEGFSKICYDGKPFFSTTHKVGKSMVSNKGTAKLSPESYKAGRKAIMSMKNDSGKSLNLKSTLLVVSPANEDMGMKILIADQIDGTTNTLKGTAELLVVPDLAGEGEEGWYLLCTNRPIKPLVYQEREVPKFKAFNKETDVNVFMNKQFLYGTDGRLNVGFTLWQLAYGSDGTAA